MGMRFFWAMLVLVGCEEPAAIGAPVAGDTGAASFVAHDGDELVAVVWDGSVAQVIRGTRTVSIFDAASVPEALWGAELAVDGELTSARIYDRALAPRELDALAHTAWPQDGQLWSCNGPGVDDCEPGAPAGWRL